MTPKEERFVAEYLIDLNAADAARRAGYDVVHNEGFKLTQRTNIKAAIAKAMKKREERTEITQDRVLQEYAKLAFSNMADYLSADGAERYVDLSTMDRDKAAAIQEYTVETFVGSEDGSKDSIKKTRFKLADKKGALDSVARHLGMFNDKSEITHKGGFALIIDEDE